MEAALIPLDQLIPEFLLALGGAFLLGNLAAYIRLRSAWREAKGAGRSRAEGNGKAASTKTANADASTSKVSGPKVSRPGTTALPSRTRVLTNVLVGLVVTVASLAALIARG
jgi:hypothetical protein